MRRVLPPLLRENTNFRRYFIGQAASLIGDQITLIALPLTAVLALDATPAQMGALLTAALVPNLIFALHAGVWIDRRGRRRQVMIATDIGRGLLIATVPIAYAVGHLTWTQLYVVAFLAGTLDVFFFVAYGAFFQLIVERVRLRVRELTDPRQPRVLVRRRQQPRRHPRAAAPRPVRARGRRVLLFLVGVVPRTGRRRGAAGRAARRGRARRRCALDPPQRDHPRRAARRRDAQPVQLHVLRAVRALRDALSAREARAARDRARRGVDRRRSAARSSPDASRAGSGSAPRSSPAASSSRRR